MVTVLAGFVALLLAAPAAAQSPGGHIALPDELPGDRLLVNHRTPEGDFELHTVNWNASDRTVLTSGAADFAGTWSPDGRHVAFHRVEAPADGLYVVTSDGATTTRLADWGASPSWSPDSSRLVYSPAREGSPEALHIATLDGSLTPIPGTEGGVDPVWSPNGAWIAYGDPGGALTVVRPDGADRRVVAGDAFDHEWAPDSGALTYVTGSREGAPGDPDARLMIVRRDGTGTRELARFPRIIQPAFSPSGRDIAFSARSDGSLDIWHVEVATGGVSRVTESAADDLHPTWTAGTFAIAFTRMDDVAATSSPTDVWWAAPLGGHEQRITDTGRDRAEEFAPGLTLRLAGADRVRTAIELSRTFPAASTVVIARADDHPDALAGAPLAAAHDAPVLLTGREGLHPALPAELDRLGADHAYLLGGHAALSPQVEADLADAGITTTRLAGTDRFATAAAVADALADVAGPPERVFIVEGRHPDPARGWPDAVSASGAAALAGEPVLLVVRDQLPPATRDAVGGSGADRALIVGGTAAVSETVATQLRGHVVDHVDRVAGTDRYDTSAKVADLAVAAGGDPAYPWLATGRNWPDALATAPAAARDGGVLLLVDGSTWRLPVTVENWLTRGDEGRVRRGVIVGGTAAIRPDTRTSLENALQPVS